MRRSGIVALLAVLPLAACTTTSPPPPKRAVMSLVAFDSCAQLEKELRKAAQDNQKRPLPDTARAPLAAEAAPAQASVEAYSGTNVHEQGVDEPDMVKTDGRRIVTVSGGVLRVVDAASRTETGSLALRPELGGPGTLLLAGDRALVLMSPSVSLAMDERIGGPVGVGTEILLVDLTGAPRLISRYRGDGRLVDARQNADVARVVLSSTPQIDSLLPTWDVTTGTSRTDGRLGCEQVSRPTGSPYSGTQLMRVLTFDLRAPRLDDGAPVGVLADGDVVYGTANSLYVANNPGWRLNTMLNAAGVARQPMDAEIFKFDLPPAGKPVLAASGKVPGTLLNQYALSEWDGHLRVATTDSVKQSSAVRVLRQQDTKLTEVGEVGGLGENERIYSVRFIGPRAYVVTFRQTDPLYSLDLSDPSRPRVTGELKITGFSAHLQPVGENRLVGIGQEATTQGRATGMQVSLFDVTDPAAPARLAQHFVAGASSEAEYDPRALLWWPATNLLVVPLVGGALALHVTADGLREAGQLVPPAHAVPRRTLVVGDVLWTVTDTGLLASRLSTLDRLAWLPV
ncbi:benzoate transporter [Actinoplanes sp. TBRC 11911]|uniref:beta-propeller domain-containing protein n=1 Tax=Actinoplanes sp. TBRC 11911 TaxID=2729386 RepID=UPI00145EC8DA|nr:beta-propeller domain-containing protein [Actinoplanes sp. TBRC 11911]NMO54457.1 benzoate transporter [Actinoplanes sp. TBRC 11911]